MASSAGRFTKFTMLAAAALLAGCGGGSSSNSTATSATGTSGGVVSSKSGAFSTVVPPGFGLESSQAEYWATGPEAGELITSVIVLRQPARQGDINSLAHQTLHALVRPPKAKQVSPIRSLSVDGEPALALDYVVTPPRRGKQKQAKEQHVTLVFVRHGEWVYLIREFASPALYSTAVGALEDVIRNWHWR